MRTTFIAAPYPVSASAISGISPSTSAIIATRPAISVAVTSPMSGRPNPDAATPAPVMYAAVWPVRLVSCAEMPSKTPGAMTSSRLASSFQPLTGRGGSHADSFRFRVSPVRRDGRCQHVHQVIDVVEVFEADDRVLNRLGASAACDAVGERMELSDQFVVGDRVGGRTVRHVDAGAVHSPSRVVTVTSVRNFSVMSAWASDSSRCTVVAAISDQMSSESKRLGVNCSGNTVPSSNAAAVAYPIFIWAPIGVSGRCGSHQPCL